MTEKTCICCRQIKPLDAYSSHKQMKDGRLNKCKACCVEYARQHRASRPAEELRAMRHAEYEACIRSGSRTRERSLDEVRAQHDPVNRKINALRKAMSRSALVDDLKKLADVDEKVRKGEREAFGLDDVGKPENEGLAAMATAELQRLRERLLND